jgi:hypothetical protein
MVLMPRKGYRSITVPDDVFDYFKKEWEKHEEEYRRKGVRSFSGFISKKLTELMELEGRRSK